MNTSLLNILIVDDDSDDQLLLQEGLTHVVGNLSFTVASDGIECLSLLKKGYKPDVIFMDINMPLKNGLECLRDIHNQNLLSETPVIICSTSHYLKDILAASEYGAKFYLIKPTSYPELYKILEYVVYMLNQPKDVQAITADFVIGQPKLRAA